MKDFIRVMKALSDPNRVRIVKLLQLKELCVCELQELLGLAQSTVSKHLKVLDDAGLISSSRDGAWVIYIVNENDNSAHVNALLAEMRGWVEEDSVYVINSFSDTGNISSVIISKYS